MDQNENKIQGTDHHVDPAIDPVVDLPEEAPIVETEQIDAHVDDRSVEEHPIDAEEQPERPVNKTNAQNFHPMNMAEQATNSDVLYLPSDLDKNVDDDVRRAPNVDMNDTKESNKWASVVVEGLRYNTKNEVLVDTLNDPEAEFNNNPQYNNQNLSAAIPRYKASENQTLKGERSVIHFASHLGAGTVFQVPMWHSGIWVTLKPPSESELIELNRQIAIDKIDLGRHSYGLMHSNRTAFLADRLITFALQHVYNLTTKTEDINENNLLDHLVVQDIPALLWGIICTQYHRGFKYRRGCTHDTLKCNHIVSETLNVMKLQYTNMSALTEWQRTFMAGRQSKMKTKEEVARYKEELVRLQKKRVTVHEGKENEFSFTIKSPTIREHIESAHQWISGIVENVDRVLASDASNNERNALITLNGQATAMREYAHWIDSIEFNGNIVEDRESIEKNLGMMSSDDAIREAFMKEIINFINRSTMSLIGIPVYDCPKCGKEQEANKNLPHFTTVIPLDVYQTFFGLMTQRLQRIAGR